MNKLNKIIVITTILCGFVFILTILDIAALHDISKDYVSQSVLDYLKIDISHNLPEWTATEGEWQVVTFSLFLRFLFLIFNFVILIYLYRKVIPLNGSKYTRP